MTVEVKICGISTEAAMDAAIEHGADYVGLVHFPKSPRHVDLPFATRLAAHARSKGGVKLVVLLVDPDDRTLLQVHDSVMPDFIQLHGHETVTRTRDAHILTGLPVMKAISVTTREDVGRATGYVAEGRADFVLFDAKPPSDPDALPGGNGLSFDWNILESWDRARPFALAGGLTPKNVAAAVRLTRPAIADVSSGVESAPGVKDAELIRRFITNAKTAI
jgi:phosphoribosylanthranilate isomerase